MTTPPPTIVRVYLIASLLLTASCSNSTPDPGVCRNTSVPSPRVFSEEAPARSIADSWTDRHEPESMAWDWGPAVLAYGLLDLYEATGDERYWVYVDTWARHHAPDYRPIWSDNLAPVASATRLAGWNCDPVFVGLADQAWNYLLHAAPRTVDGGISHLGIFAAGAPQLWVDSLFMFGSYLIARGRVFGDSSAWDLYADQILIFARALQDRSGFFRHALIDERPAPAEPVFWARGNGWIATILPRFLGVLPKTHPDRTESERIAADLLQAALRTQDESGFWRTVPDRPGASYLETSAAALLADGLVRGAALGLVGQAEAAEAYDRAIAAIKTRIRDIDGSAIVSGASIGTIPGDFDNYAGVPQADDIPYGVGAILLAFTSKTSDR